MLNIKELEERKLKEMQHSRLRRTILQGYERRSDTHKSEEAWDLRKLIRDKKAFDYHFSNVKFYSITHLSETFQYGWMKRRCYKGIRVLDFACGSGENGIYAARCGAEVTGIDISPEGVENANLNAKLAGVFDRCRFQVMDGENMTFPDNTFELAVEYGALHHVDLRKAMAELNRVLKPGGEMICIEALRHNPFIHWYRKRTRHLRTEWEINHILRVQELDIVREYFSIVSIKFFHLAVLAAIPFRKTGFFKPLRRVLDNIDALLLGNELIGKYGWIMIFIIRKPD